MGMKFDTEKIIVYIENSIMETLKEVLKNKGLGNRIEQDRILIIDDVTVKEVNGREIVCEVEYEYE